MTKAEAITELVRIWHSPHLDLSLKAGLAEAIDTLKESNLNDSLVRGEVDVCKESESKLDLISRADAIEAIEEITWYHQNRNGEMVSGANDAEHQAWYKSQDIYTALESLPSAKDMQNMKAWNGLYIKVYADDDPQDKAEKLYQICDSNEALSEIAKCIQGYLDEPSAEARPTGEWVWSDEDASWMCGACCCVFEEIDWKPNYNFCPNCGADMRGEEG